MTKRDKRETAIRRNARSVRFDDLDLVLRAAEFTPRKESRGSSHVTYTHPLMVEILTVVMPHGGATHVREYQVKHALAAIDAVRAKE